MNGSTTQLITAISRVPITRLRKNINHLPSESGQHKRSSLNPKLTGTIKRNPIDITLTSRFHFNWR